jgi:hypothetical protein
MTTDTPNPSMDAVARTRPPGGPRDTGGRGSLTFAGTMLIVVGAANLIGGIAAVSDSKFFAGSANYMVGDLESLGWVVLVVGAVQLIAGAGIFSRAFWAVWLGVVSAGVNAIGQLLLLPAQPLWSVAIFAIDVVVMNALITHGDTQALR